MNWKTIFNPFERFDEKLLLTISLFSLGLFLAAGYWSNTFFSSIYKINHVEQINFQNIAVPTLISFAVAIIVLFMVGKIVNRKTRIIDIVNTVIISQLPLLIILPFEKISSINEAGEKIGNYHENAGSSFPVADFIIITSFSLITLTALIYSIIIYYNGFKTATNIKKWQHIALFAIVSFLTILICQLFNH
jgi:hypothetical protein